MKPMVLTATVLAALVGFSVAEGGVAERLKLAAGVRNKPVTLTGTEVAKFKTSRGTFKMKFYETEAPNTVKHFIRLAEAGFYDGLTFHRYVPGFVIQGGDPKGDGTGDCGWDINAEFNDKPFVEGVAGIARSDDPNSGSCQFFFMLAPAPHLNGNYTAFGIVTSGMDVVKSLRQGDKIVKVTILRPSPEAQPAPTSTGGK